MKRRLSRGLLAAVVGALALVWGGAAQAYLSPNYADTTYQPVDPNTGLPGVNYPWVPGPGDVPDYLTTPNWAYTPPLRKFVDGLPGIPNVTSYNVGPLYNGDGTTLLNQAIPLAVPDTTTYPGSDYYEIELVQYTKQMHSDLPPTTLRGYRQTNLAGGPATPHYLGPLILAQKDRPVRIKFTNSLPDTLSGGKLFVPVDTTVMGSGPYETGYDAQNQPDGLPGMFAENRATLHLHGGKSPWISDGTPHQWITPAAEALLTNYPKGVSVVDVPDMPAPGAGAQTFYWTNQQSARLMFYHDHAWGITRLNVYVGEAAGYLIQDPVELDLVNGTNNTGVNPNNLNVLPFDQIPLIIQDKTFVDAAAITATDPTWIWGTGADANGDGFPDPNTGDLWWPHVYMPAQNPFDITGIAPMGRWAYGPYFWPATNNLYQPVPNPYYSDQCNPADPATPGSYGGFCQPFEIPSTPNPSWGAEAFMDTPIVNGTAYPVLNVDPKPYRLRMLNAAHDRFLNLSLFVAADKNSPTTEGTVGAVLCDGVNPVDPANCTEVSMLTAAPNAAFPATWPADGRAGGVPDPATAGPNWIMFGTEGGFLPKPVVIPANPVTWNADVTTFNAGNVNGGSLMLGPAERADVVVDFSAFAGKTLILYNDAPAPWPALDPHYDYYTGAPDNRPMGGYGPTTPAGFGPNTRTIMQIRVAAGAGTPYDLAALQAAFKHGDGVDPNKPSVFEAGQDVIPVGQGNLNPTGDPAFFSAFLFSETFDAYQQAYGRTYPVIYPNWGISRINDKVLNFYGGDGSTTYIYNAADNTPLPWDPNKVTKGGLPMNFKAIQDEQGETFDDYGRMRAALGLELITPGAGRVNFIVQTYSDPATEVLEQQGFQIWKITHNGVDTHPIHFHLFDVQVLNRVGWDGFIRLPDPTELGWKDTVRISPLEDTIVAVRPTVPKVPFGVPESWRPLNPATTLGSPTELSLVDPTTGQAWATPNLNRVEKFDWEYVWHCHILSHEENDMMRSIVYKFQEAVPGAFSITSSTLTPGQVALAWTDPTPAADLATPGNATNEIGYYVQRATGGGSFATVATTLANATSYTDATIAASTAYDYRVVAFNAAGTTTTSNTVTVTPPSITTASPMPSGQRTVAYSQTLAATGGTAPYTWAITVGSLPAGLSLDGATGAITGTPTTLGTSNFTAQVTDANAVTATKALSISIITPLTITTGAMPVATVGVPYQAFLGASGGVTPYTWSLAAGSLPNGLTLRVTDGRIAGTPSAAGTFNFTARVTDSQGAITTKALSIVVNPSPLSITTAALSNATLGTAYQVNLAASGGLTPYTWAITAGSLPTGLTLTASTGRISGTPTALGTFTFTVRVTDSQATPATASRQLSITVNPAPLVITTNTLPAATLGTAYQAFVTATGGVGPYVWAVQAGNLPNGLALNASTGRISGTPTATGTFTFTISVRDSQATPATTTKQLSITVNIGPLAVTTATLPAATLGTAYQAFLAATGGVPPRTWAITAGALPPGMVLTASTGRIAGTPTARGTFTFTVQVTDSQATPATATRQLSITVN